MNTVCIKYKQSAKSQKPWMENVSLATSAGCHDLAVAFKKDGYGFVRNKLQFVSDVSIPQGGIGNSVFGSHGWCSGNMGGGAEMRGVKSFGQSLDRGLGCPQFEEVSTTLVNGTAPGHHTGVLATGVDVYNKSLTGNVSKTLGTSATDSDHVPCAIIKKMQDFIDSLPSSIVRRLTPLECERLQGFPDYWTLVPTKKWRIIDDLLYDELCSIGLGGYCRKANRRGKEVIQTCLASDGPRYKAIGNSWAVNNAQWIFQRIEEHDRDEAMQNAFA